MQRGTDAPAAADWSGQDVVTLEPYVGSGHHRPQDIADVEAICSPADGGSGEEDEVNMKKRFVIIMASAITLALSGCSSHPSPDQASAANETNFLKAGKLFLKAAKSTKALDKLKEGAKDNERSYEYFLGYYYEVSRTYSSSGTDKSLYWFNKLFRTGNNFGKCMAVGRLYNIYLFGTQNFKANPQKAISFLTYGDDNCPIPQNADKSERLIDTHGRGMATRELLTAFAYERTKNYKKAILWYSKAFSENNTILRKTSNVTADRTESGNISNAELANMKINGLGTHKDCSNISNLINDTRFAGSALAYYFLLQAYEKGACVPMNKTVSLSMLTLVKEIGLNKYIDKRRYLRIKTKLADSMAHNDVVKATGAAKDAYNKGYDKYRTDITELLYMG